MNLFKHNLTISETRSMINITDFLRNDIKESKVDYGIAVIYCPHTTAGITINENADPDVKTDLLYGFDKIFPVDDSNYRHFEGNSNAHLSSSSIGVSQTIIIEAGKPLLGIWQDLYFCEFDGPRNRVFYIKIISD